VPGMNPISRFFVNLSASRRAAREFEWIRSEVPIPPAARCLEIGCGNGNLAVRFAEGFRPAEYVATDVDPFQVEEARQVVARRYRAGPPPGLSFREADMLKLPFPDGAFDVVLAFVTIHHASPSHHDFSRVPEALSEFDRVLRPGGLLVYQEFLHREAIRKWLTDRGFGIVRIRRRWRLESVVGQKRAGPAGPMVGVGTSSDR
jgi:ubiquinone/menaquinone biosynthesis C-methylase UbiE